MKFAHENADWTKKKRIYSVFCIFYMINFNTCISFSLGQSLQIMDSLSELPVVVVQHFINP